MSRYIDADVLITRWNNMSVRGRTEFDQEIMVAPSIDIVRCKECVKANTEDCSHSYWDDDWGEWHTDYKGDDWFCADGERSSE